MSIFLFCIIKGAKTEHMNKIALVSRVYRQNFPCYNTPVYLYLMDFSTNAMKYEVGKKNGD